MAVRAAIALSLAALAWAALPWAGSAWAEDDPACAQYHEPMAYNACLARHGPKANGVGSFQAVPISRRRARRRRDSEPGAKVLPALAGRPARPWAHAHGVSRSVSAAQTCERGARARGNSAGAALFSPRCGRAARGPRFAPSPEARRRGIVTLGDRSPLAIAPSSASNGRSRCSNQLCFIQSRRSWL